MLGSVLRPLPSAWIGSATKYEEACARFNPPRAWLLDPLLGAGYRWLIVPNLLVTALLAALAWRRMRGCRASRARSLGWVSGVLLCGACAWLASAALETRRAWTRPEPRPRASLKIRAA